MKLLSAVALSVLVVNAVQAQNSLPPDSIFQVEETPNLFANNLLSAISGDAENDVWAVGPVPCSDPCRQATRLIRGPKFQRGTDGAPRSAFPTGGVPHPNFRVRSI